MKYDIAAYIWPAYTGDEPRTRMFWPDGEGEWQTVRQAQPKFDGHKWPRKPLWGYQNEADPKVMEHQIDKATEHGVNVFIYDWYWYDGRPFLENCLNDGFLKAQNRDKMKFYIMWANHDVTSLWDKRLSDEDPAIIWQGKVDRTQFEQICDRVIEKYFKLPNYYTIDGKPVFMIYDITNLMKGLGGVEQTKDALVWFRQRCVECGLPGLHLQMTVWWENQINFSGIDGKKDLNAFDAVREFGFDSATHYQYAHFANIDRDYLEVLEDVKVEWNKAKDRSKVPYYPHVSVGWDNNPRFKKFRPGIMKNNTPQNFKVALEEAKAFIDALPNQAPLITINSWNEWTEGSYLEPDDLYGYGYLEAIKDVFM